MTTSGGAAVKAAPWKDPAARPYVQVDHVTKSFGDFKAVDDVSLKIYNDGEDMTGVPPYERPVNMMFQSYALFPHMNVEQNVAFGLKQDRIPKQEMRERVATMLDLVKL